MASRNLGHVSDNDYYYAVLNLSKYASQTEINERHRSLSLVFHPDRQTDPEVKETATKEFLEIQKAYQVLSDPFLRQVYDTLGPDGLALQWPPIMHSKSKEEIQDILEKNKVNLTRKQVLQSIIPKGSYTCSFDASPIFSSSLPLNGRWAPILWDRVGSTRTISHSFNYTLEKKVNEKVTVLVTSRNAVDATRGTHRFLGTVRYQFSPRLVTAATFNFAHPYSTTLEANYEDPDNAFNIKTIFSPLLLAATPPMTVSFSRRLFRSSPQRGKIDLHLGKQPSLGLFYVSPPLLNLSEEEGSSFQKGPPSVSGFKYVAFERSFGLLFDTIIPRLVAESSVVFVELSARLKASLQLGPGQLLLTLGASWSNETTEISSNLVLNPQVLLLQLDFTYLQQQISLPIILSTQFSPILSLGTIVIPSTVAVLGYNFFVIPRRRARRIAHIRAAKKAFEEDSDSRKERNAVESLLKDAVRKYIRTEKEKEGLIILEAMYGAAENDLDGIEDNLLLDVTIPLQALVRNSQLHIPGGNTKAAIQGFSDPAPFASKSLRIRYTFRGRMHYAEIPDYLPVVLPLSEHQVKGP
ncbi:DnaJ-domain-containing protein [Agrocybe pediades]|nr:DnaJ-domain-containing protein [Agrocybe pediades]